MRARERLSVQVDTELMEKLRATAEQQSVKLSDIVRQALTAYTRPMNGDDWERLGAEVGKQKAEQVQEPPFRRINGVMWADVDDEDQLGRARAFWAETRLDETPAVLPFHGGAGEDPELFTVEQYTPKQLWAWVDRYTG